MYSGVVEEPMILGLGEREDALPFIIRCQKVKLAD